MKVRLVAAYEYNLLLAFLSFFYFPRTFTSHFPGGNNNKSLDMVIGRRREERGKIVMESQSM
jgi:hypothetical protein